jgi:hypothetical protein
MRQAFAWQRIATSLQLAISNWGSEIQDLRFQIPEERGLQCLMADER